MLAVNHYIRNELSQARELLRAVTAKQIMASNQVQSGRLLSLFALLKVLVCLPRFPVVANLFYRRWHAPK